MRRRGQRESHLSIVSVWLGLSNAARYFGWHATSGYVTRSVLMKPASLEKALRRETYNITNVPHS